MRVTGSLPALACRPVCPFERKRARNGPSLPLHLSPFRSKRFLNPHLSLRSSWFASLCAMVIARLDRCIASTNHAHYISQRDADADAARF